MALLIIAALIGALWQRRRARLQQPRADIGGEAFSPTSAPGIIATPFMGQHQQGPYQPVYPEAASPPYSPPATESVYSASGSGSGGGGPGASAGNRYSADSKAGLLSASTGRMSNPDPEMWRPGGSILPAGAARPLSPGNAAVHPLVAVQDLEEQAARLGYELNPSRSPPPMYPVEKRDY